MQSPMMCCGKGWGNIVGNSVVKLTKRVNSSTQFCKGRSCRGYNIHLSEGPNDNNDIGKSCQMSVDHLCPPNCLPCLAHAHHTP